MTIDPKRQEGETYEEYRQRRRMISKYGRDYLRGAGRTLWNSKELGPLDKHKLERQEIRDRTTAVTREEITTDVLTKRF